MRVLGDRRPRGWLLGALLGVASCSTTSDGPTAGCLAGRVRACACAGGEEGVQRCGADRRYEPCECETTVLDAGVDVGTVAVDAAAPDVSPMGRDVVTAPDAPDVASALPGCSEGTPCDQDGDGVPGIQCAGLDCDDRDCRRHQGRAEVCDAFDVDEDCDPCTVAGPRGSGDGDRDRDTFVASTCRNPIEGRPTRCDAQLVTVDTAGGRVTGRDCADDDNNRRPDQAEICNGVDDNCNGAIDEDFRGGSCGTALPGVCGDGVNECRLGRITCVATVTPGVRAEVCNGLDDDCDGTVDEAVPRSGEACRPAGVTEPMPVACRLGRLACLGGREVCQGGARPETCNGLDDDCDGMVDEDPDASASCAITQGTARCREGACVVETCNLAMGDCDGDARNGCEADLRSSAAHCGRCAEACEGRCTDGWCSTGPQGLAAGPDHTCVLRGGGAVACWGRNDGGVLGDGSLGFYNTAARPVLARGTTGVVEIDRASATSLRLASGQVAQLGWGNLPRDVGASDIVAVDGECGARRGGEIVSWQSRRLVTAAPPLAGVTALLGRAACAINGEGGLSCRADDAVTTPWATVPLPRPVTSACVGYGFRCATTIDGAVWCWGDNAQGQLGDGTFVARPTPRAATGVTDAISVACVSWHACALRRSGAVICWGDNSSGQLGTGDRELRSSPAEVEGVTHATHLVCGDSHTCVRLADGRVTCWGSNERGQLGGGITAPRTRPTLVSFF